MVQKTVLGKGLASLLPGAANMPPPPPVVMQSMEAVSTPVANDTNKTTEESNRDRHPGISIALVGDIHVNPFQPRREFDESHIEELAQSIRINGIIQPLVVRKVPKGYELIAGERRLRAAKKAGLQQVPIVIRRSTDRESLELALIENIQRQDLGCVEEAKAYAQLVEEFNLTQEELAKRMGKDRATVANHLRLLKLPEVVLEDLRLNRLTFGHAKVLMALEDKDVLLRFREKIIAHHWSVRETESEISAWKETAQTPASGATTEPESPLQQTFRYRISNLGRELSRMWNTKVDIKGSEQKGKIVLHYRNSQDLHRLVDYLKSEKLWQEPTI